MITENTIETNDNEEYRIDEIRDAIRDIEQRFDCADSIYVVLYKMVGTKAVHMAKYTIESLPDAHEIGREYGAGVYNLRINFKDEKNKKHLQTNRRFILGSHYDELKADYKREQQLLKVQPTQNNNLDIINMMNQKNDETIKMIMSMMENQVKMMAMMFQQQQARPATESTLIEKLLPELIRDKSQQNTEILKSQMEIFKTGIEQGQKMATPEEPDTKGELIRMLIENADKILSPFVPKKIVRSSQYVQQLKQNPDLIKPVIEAVTKEKGKSIADRLLSKAGLQEGKAA